MDYNPSWLVDAVPFKDRKPARCSTFRYIQNSSCLAENFNQNITESCNKWIYETSEISIIQDFNLHCDSSAEKLALVGTLNGVEKFIGMPLAGYISDKFGRKKVIILTSIVAGVLGIIRSFSSSYIFFIVMETVEACINVSIYTSLYVLGAELVGPQKRRIITTMQFVSFSLGGVFLGTAAWQIQSWRTLLRILYSLNFLVIFYIWLLPESVRWLLVNNKIDQAKNILKNIGKINKKLVPEETISNLSIKNMDESNKLVIPITDFFKSRVLLFRCIISSFCWISSIFVYYGLSIIATTLSSNKYLDFILSSLVEIPGYFTAHFVVDKIGRKKMLFSFFLLSSISSIAFIVLPIEIHWVQLILYLISKYGISIVVYGMYVTTNEMFPTSLRQTLLSVCSMFGRIGNILAPQLILTQNIWYNFPLALFSILTGMCSILSLFLPETRNIILPNTIQEAERVGTKC